MEINDKYDRNPGTAIVLSAGYFGFYAHAGFMQAVEECGINYTAIAGSSAGALVAALHASGVPAAEIIDMLLSARRQDLWDSVGAVGLLKSLARRGRGLTGLLKGERFEERIRRQLRVPTFAECPRALYITALNLTRGVEETFTTGTIADKVRASCAYPFLMAAKTIGGDEYWDGGFLKVFHGVVDMTPDGGPGPAVHPTMTHFFYMDQEDNTKVRRWVGAVGPVGFG